MITELEIWTENFTKEIKIFRLKGLQQVETIKGIRRPYSKPGAEQFANKKLNVSNIWKFSEWTEKALKNKVFIEMVTPMYKSGIAKASDMKTWGWQPYCHKEGLPENR